MPTPVVGNDAMALLYEVEHLRVPIIRTQRPAMMKHNRLRALGAPILEVDLRAVFCCDRVHKCLLVNERCGSRWGNLLHPDQLCCRDSWRSGAIFRSPRSIHTAA